MISNLHRPHKILIAIFLLTFLLAEKQTQAQSITIDVKPEPGGVQGTFATGWVSVNGTNKISGDLKVSLNSSNLNNETAGRGWMRFDLSGAGIPPNSTITAVTLTREMVSAIYTQTIKGYATIRNSVDVNSPDPVLTDAQGLPNTTLYSALNGTTWNFGSLGAANPRDLGAEGINAVQDYVNGGDNSVVVLGFPNISSIGSIANIAGYDNADSTDRPFLEITYETTTNINGADRIIGATVSPNPAGNKCTIKSKTPLTGFSIADLTGAEIFSDHFFQDQKKEAVVDLSRLPSGIYFLKIFSENNSVIKKIIRE